jgi:hypothetical protein
VTTALSPAPPAAPAAGEREELGAAAERFVRLTLRRSAQTQATYASACARFGAWLGAFTGLPAPPVGAFTADALAAYVDHLEAHKAPATVRKERAALNRLARYLHALGAIDATEILMIEGTRATGPAPPATPWTAPPGSTSRTSPAPATSGDPGAGRARPPPPVTSPCSSWSARWDCVRRRRAR